MFVADFNIRNAAFCHIVYLLVPCYAYDKQLLFLYTKVTDWTL